ncbi:methionine ABC transporter permease [Dolosigranulum pigrum]|jgi:ABC transporter, permease protein|uniref:ABC transmembrane type-1 domain-containing protein n=3 Tax=Dolosigranulum TaxID=29393 RepID=H3NCW8_9LACT|nr:methionine ABC transporter permease [Dolosigranulum pigrum]EHR34561.1 hypothetical protein HMPREF9703_00399 [Dolosigranulum pigrum ATCC 51524]QDO90660.1 ABC transporter permease [Dolosigranulum pigrum]QJS95611.1 ABC transporter permease [Dolosigranulum pigrum]QJS97537.1 ABC transporter permease [Dolosigranulum pigrum]QTJ33922.1 ABC transporter permease [Dolosigranulum pigrum]
MTELLEQYLPNVVGIQDRIIENIIETVYMTISAALIAGILGIIFGIILTVTYSRSILENKLVYNILDKAINTMRSIPFIIMLALIYPITRFFVGTSIGTTASIVPLVFATVPFYAKQVESALLEVDSGVVEAAQAMGSSPIEIIFSVYLKEGLPSLIRVSSVTIVSLISMTAMAGAVGGGGLGDLAIARGYNRFQSDVTFVATVLIMILVFTSQAIGNYFIRKTDHNK